MREQLRWNGCEAVDEWFQVTDRAQIIRKEIARFLSERLGNADEIFDVQPALSRLQSCEVSGRHGDGAGYIRLAATLRLAELPEDAAVHVRFKCTPLANQSRLSGLFARQARSVDSSGSCAAAVTDAPRAFGRNRA